MKKPFNLTASAISIGAIVSVLILSILCLSFEATLIFNVLSGLAMSFLILALPLTIYMLLNFIYNRKQEKYFYIPNFVLLTIGMIIAVIFSIICIINGSGQVVSNKEYVILAFGVISLLMSLGSLTLNFAMFSQWIKN